MMELAIQQAFWEGLAKEMSSGTPLPAALRKAGTTSKHKLLAGMADEMALAVEAGQSLSAAILPFSQMYDERILAAVQAGEQAGNLDEVADHIAQALARGEMGYVSPPPEDEHISRVLIEILTEAIRSRATDVAVESLELGRARIRHRIDGVMHEMRMLPEGSAQRLVARIKQMASLDVAERRLPMDGRIPLVLEKQELDLRISTVPGVYGERVMMRVLRRQAVFLGLDKIGLTAENLATVQRFCHLPQGIVVVNGPTGSGKTTLLYSMLLEIDQTGNSILTVEDPVEYAFDKITQIQIRPEIGLTFSRAIRSILRQAANVIMIGEIRDREMLEMSVQSAMTGHLVMTTLHATTSPGAICRMLDIGLLPFMLNSSLIGVISQKLVRLLCPDCKQPARIDQSLLPAEARPILARHKNATWFGPKGCPACTQTGYRGMTAIHEVLIMDDPLRQAVSTNPTATQLRDVATQHGMKTMLEDGLTKATQGLTGIDEVLRVVPTGTYQ